MRKLFPATLLFLAIPVVAHAGEPHRVKRDGHEFEYVSTTLPNGSRRITGTDLKTGEKFRFVAGKHWVTGRYGTSRVSFRTPKSKSAVAATELASK